MTELLWDYSHNKVQLRVCNVLQCFVILILSKLLYSQLTVCEWWWSKCVLKATLQDRSLSLTISKRISDTRRPQIHHPRLPSQSLSFEVLRVRTFQSISSDEVLSAVSTPSNNTGCCCSCFSFSFKHIFCSTLAFCLSFLFNMCCPSNRDPLKPWHCSDWHPLRATVVSGPGRAWT